MSKSTYESISSKNSPPPAHIIDLTFLSLNKSSNSFAWTVGALLLPFTLSLTLLVSTTFNPNSCNLLFALSNLFKSRISVTPSEGAVTPI